MDVLVGFVGGLSIGLQENTQLADFGVMIGGLVLGVFNGGLTKACTGLVFDSFIRCLPLGGWAVAMSLMGRLGFTGAEGTVHPRWQLGGVMAVVA